AGPIGGDGFALPAGTCSLIKPTIFFAMMAPVKMSVSAVPTYNYWSGSSAGFRELAFGAAPERVCCTTAHRCAVADLNFFDLTEFQLYRCGTAEDGDGDAHARLLVIDFLDIAVEVRERAILDAHQFADFVQHFGTRLLDAFLHLLHDLVDFAGRDRRRLVRFATDEAGDLIGIFYQVPGFIGHFHFDST